MLFAIVAFHSKPEAASEPEFIIVGELDRTFRRQHPVIMSDGKAGSEIDEIKFVLHPEDAGVMGR